MKTIITTVGTSLLENYIKDNSEDFQRTEKFEYSIKQKERNSYEKFNKELKDDGLIEKIKEYATENFPNSSAELTSLQKLKEKYPNEEDFIIYLITSDTFEGYLIGEILKEVLEENNFKVKDVKYIEYFNVNINNRDLIRKGYKDFIKYIDKKINGYNEIINITGGYKAFIPVATIIASIKNIPLVYLFERSKYLIEIPPAPLKLDLSIIEKLKEVFEYIEEKSGIEENNPLLMKVKNNLSYQEKQQIEYLFEEGGNNMLTTSLIGDILWEEFKEKQEVKLDKCNLEYNYKVNNSNWGRHHGNDKVEEFGKKLLKNEYVCEIINSAEYEPNKKDFILEIEPKGKIGVIKIKIPNEIYTLLVQTTGKNKRETSEIAKILQKEYGG
jgi:putative CRISPR-associated protein (TIGR02619 family)